ncbi:MAG: glycosyltransferase [Bacteroidales bacterium]|nr:glycosyltransferase [Bacteroidales bacterium]
MVLEPSPKIYIALPVLNELDFLPKFIASVEKQNYRDFELFICINQPDKWWNDEEKSAIYKNNQETISYLQKIKKLPVTIIDKSSIGKGWNHKHYGVGWARKTLMDAINDKANENDIIVSLDADTTFSENYFSSIIENIKDNPKAVAISVPYYHKLEQDEETNRAILHYEIYMRHYSVNLWRIKSPYSFSALGSAIVLPVWSYRAVGGITPHKSGEDFYFLQKLRKFGEIICCNTEKVFPAARFSDRVFFGTGPAMIKGRAGDWTSYPIYHYSLFDDIKKTYKLFPDLFFKDVETPMSDFLKSQFKQKELWQPLRKNFKTTEQFVKAAHHKIDGLRILQYLKSRQKRINYSDEECLIKFLIKFYGKQIKNLNVNFDSFSFQNSKIEELDEIRNFLMDKETEYQSK